MLSRLKSYWPFKLIVGSLVVIVFTAGYALLQRFPVNPVVYMKPTPIDIHIPFRPNAIYLYESIWLILTLSFWSMRSREELGRYTIGFLMIMLIGFAFFFFHPTAISRPIPPGDANLIFKTHMRFDRDINAFPSLHVALAIFSGLCFDRVCRTGLWENRKRVLLWIWVAAIVFSTLLTKQHVIQDAAGGILLGVVAYTSSWRTPRAN